MSKELDSLQSNALLRKLAVGAAGARGGLGLFGSRAASMFKSADERQRANEESLAREARRFVAELGKLKGAYVKIGQMLALYGEPILPPVLVEAFHELTAKTEPLSWKAISPTIEQQLGEDFSRFTIERSAFAAASLAQVHRASIELEKTKKKVALKAQYPGVSKTIESDFDSVINLLKLARWVKSGRDLEATLSQVKRLLALETDYHREQQQLVAMAGLVGDHPVLFVPHLYREFCNEELLVMEYVDGLDVSDARVQELPLPVRNQLAESMLELFFREVFEWRLMQTDANFGNYRIIIENDSARIALLDFGSVKELEEEFTRALRKVILAAAKEDMDRVIEGAIELNFIDADSSDDVKQSFAEFCAFIIEPLKQDLTHLPPHLLNKDGMYRWSESKLLRRAGKEGANKLLHKGFKMPPPEFMLIVRKLTGVFSFIATLDAEMNCYEVLQRFDR